MTRVLLLEDNHAYATLTTLLVEEALGAGVEVHHVDSVADAEAAAEAADCVLMDLSLPDGEGLGAIERLRTAAPSVPLVVLSGRETTPSFEAALQERGVSGYVLKGDEDESLGPALRRALGQG